MVFDPDDQHRSHVLVIFFLLRFVFEVSAKDLFDAHLLRLKYIFFYYLKI